jgi:hypothetical protein
MCIYRHTPSDELGSVAEGMRNAKRMLQERDRPDTPPIEPVRLPLTSMTESP